MKNKFRKSNLEDILSQIAKDGAIEEIMKGFLGTLKDSAKDMFFDSLTPIGREAYKIGFQLIESEYYVEIEHEDDEIRDNWFNYFIEYHDYIIDIISKGDDNIFKFAIDEMGEDYINNIYRQDSRTLEEILEFVSEKNSKARKLKSEYERKLQEKLRTQLGDVITTLKYLTSENNDGIKHFEIGLDDAHFSVTVGDTDGCDCETDTDSDTDDASFEMFAKKLDKIFKESIKKM